MRNEYAARPGLTEADLAAGLARPSSTAGSPTRWRAGLPEPNAMVLATADAAGRPSARTVLLKGSTSAGFVFFTNYDSRKGAEAPPTRTPAWSSRGSRCSGRWWSPARVAPVDRAETEAYFATRPRGSQLGAWASPQSQVVPDRAALDEAYAAAVERVRRRGPSPGAAALGRAAGRARRRWSSGRAGPSRLHDRLRFRRTDGRRLDRRAAGPVTEPSRQARPATRGAARWAHRHCGRCGIPRTGGCGSATRCRCFGFQFTAVAVPVQMYALTRDSLWVGPARASPASCRCWSSGSGAARSPTRSTGAGCCSVSSALIWAVDARRCWSRRCCGLGSPVLLLALVGGAVGGVRDQLADPQRDHAPAGRRPSWSRRRTR